MNLRQVNNQELSYLYDGVDQLMQCLPHLRYTKWIQQALATLIRLSGEEDTLERLDWKILSASLQDMEKGFCAFHPYRRIRKVTVFGSARTEADKSEYQLALDFARCMTEQKFMVMTGAGGGIMQAANAGAGAENSFGLNIQLPFEQQANPYIARDEKLIYFKYFFTRKLFLLKESDAIALFPGGFGTQDEAFECLTLTQTGKFGPAPIVMLDKPGGDYWQEWNAYIHKQLLRRGLISPDDTSLYTITDSVDVACQTIKNFYRVYHSSRYVNDLLVIRLKLDLSETEIEQLNQEFGDILTKGKIEKSPALPQEAGDDTENLPRLILHFNQRDLGRLYQLINTVNKMGAGTALEHPEQK